MLLEVLCRDKDGLPFFTGEGPGTVGMDYVLFGDTIEIKAKADDGTSLGEWIARNVYPANVVTATQYEDGSVGVTDNAANRYEVKDV